MTVAQSAIRKTLAVAITAALLLPTQAFAGLARLDMRDPGTVIRVVPMAGGITPIKTTQGGMGLMAITDLAVPNLQTQSVQSLAPQAVPASQAIEAISKLEAAGVNVGQAGLTPTEASKLVAAAQALPNGAAKQNIVAMAQMMATAGSGNASFIPAKNDIGKVYDGSAAGKTASAVETSAPKSILSTWMSRLTGKGQKAEVKRDPIDPISREVPLQKLRFSGEGLNLPATTRDIPAVNDPAKPIVGQDNALKSLYYGLKMPGQHYNVFVAGPEGSGRETAARGLASALAKGMPTPNDLVQVTNFMDKENPLLLELPAGQAPKFEQAVAKFVKGYQANIVGALNQKEAVAARKQIRELIENAIEERKAEFDAEVDQARLPGGKFGIKILISDNGDGTVTINWAVTFPNDGQMATISSDAELESAISSGKFTRAEWEQAVKDAKHAAKPFIEKFSEMSGENNELKEKANEQIEQINSSVAQQLVQQLAPAVVGTVAKNRHDTPAHKAFEKKAQARIMEFQAEAAKVRIAGKYGLVFQTDGRQIGVALAKVVDGKLVPMAPEEMGAVIEAGEVTEAQIREAAGPLAQKFKAVLEQNNEDHAKVHENDEPVTPEEQQAMQYVQLMLSHAASNYGLFMPSEEGAKKPDPNEIYQANVQVSNKAGSGAPVVEVKDYSFDGIFGAADGNKKLMLLPNGAAVKMDGPGGASFKAGSLQKARGGYWIANAMDLLRSPGVWPALMRYVRTGEIEIVEEGLLGLASLKGARYHVGSKTKIVLVGSPMIRMMLQHYDEDFALNFPDTSTSQFEPTLPITPQSIEGYLQFFRKVVAESAGTIMHHTKDAMAALLEFASKLSGSNEKLTSQFGVAYSLMREATFFAKEAGRQEVRREDIDTALAARSLSAGVYIRHHQEAYTKGIFKIETDGEVVGQMNGLAVIGEDRGVAMRITADAVPREGGDPVLVSLDRLSGGEVTGSSFNKALGVEETIIRKIFGWKRGMPVSLRLSFEQNYGGIDGDSATSTIVYALISAISGVPIKQQFANTGSADQRYWVQPIGGVNAKIAGFYDIAVSRGLTGKQGVIIPATNVGELNLRADIVEAIKQGKFHVYAVSGIEEAMEILTGQPWEVIKAKALANLAQWEKDRQPTKK